MRTAYQPHPVFFQTTSRDHPVHLYSSSDGSLISSYRCFNHLDELEAAKCVNFDKNGQKIYAGMRNEIR